MSHEHEPSSEKNMTLRRRVIFLLILLAAAAGFYDQFNEDPIIVNGTPVYPTLENTPDSPDSFPQPTHTQTATVTPPPTPWSLHYVVQPVDQSCPQDLKSTMILQPGQSGRLETDTPIDTAEQFSNGGQQDIVICTSQFVTPLPPDGGGRG